LFGYKLACSGSVRWVGRGVIVGAGVLVGIGISVGLTSEIEIQDVSTVAKTKIGKKELFNLIFS
jgi:hypothetical protein